MWVHRTSSALAVEDLVVGLAAVHLRADEERSQTLVPSDWLTS